MARHDLKVKAARDEDLGPRKLASQGAPHSPEDSVFWPLLLFDDIVAGAFGIRFL